MTNIDTTLEERKKTYGNSYVEQCLISQNIKESMRNSPNWNDLSVEKKDCLEMIAVKISRILNGDPEYVDNWHDIIGYARLIEKELTK